jgi:hypothetical protein
LFLSGFRLQKYLFQTGLSQSLPMVRIKAAVADYLSTNQALVALANLKIQGYGISLGNHTLELRLPADLDLHHWVQTVFQATGDQTFLHSVDYFERFDGTGFGHPYSPV